MLGSPLDANGQPMFRSGQAQSRPPQQQGTPYGQSFNYTEWLQQGRPESQSQAWQQAGSPKSRPTGMQSYAQQGGYQAYAPQQPAFTQTLQTPYGQMNPNQYYQQRDAFIQTANDQMGQYMANAGTGQSPGAPPQFNPQQMWGQAGQMVEQGWQNPYAQQSAATQQQYGPAGQSGPSYFPDYGMFDNIQGSPNYRPGMAQPLPPQSQGTPYGDPGMLMPDPTPAAPAAPSASVDAQVQQYIQNQDRVSAAGKFLGVATQGSGRPYSADRFLSDRQMYSGTYEDYVRNWLSGSPLGSPEAEEARAMGRGPQMNRQQFENAKASVDPVAMYRAQAMRPSRQGDRNARGYAAAYQDIGNAARESGLFSDADLQRLQAAYQEDVRRDAEAAARNARQAPPSSPQRHNAADYTAAGKAGSAGHAKSLQSQANKNFLAGMSPDNRRIYGLMQRMR